jgi:polyphosphate glucokinase
MRKKVMTLAIDIGASFVKAAVLNQAGRYVAPPARSPTPERTNPPALLDVLDELAAELPRFHRMAVGFPGVAKKGTIITAPNLGGRWSGF